MALRTGLGAAHSGGVRPSGAARNTQSQRYRRLILAWGFSVRLLFQLALRFESYQRENARPHKRNFDHSSATNGSNIELGQRVFFNFNCVALDVCPVTIGDFTLFGPGVQILTPMHPLKAELRRQQEFGKPITIGSDVWVGGGALILPACASARAP